MKLSGQYTLLCLFLLASASIGSQELLKEMHLGFSDCAPALFVPLRTNTTVVLRDIAYAKNGMLDSFTVEVSYAPAAGTSLRATVNHEKWTGTCSSLEYTVEIAGRKQTSQSYDSFDPTKLPRTVGFSPEGAGIILAGGPLQADLSTKFEYDDRGRRYIPRQEFGVDGVSYEVVYSDYSYLGPPTGKLRSYTARIAVRAK